jgi:hypothetical protein
VRRVTTGTPPVIVPDRLAGVERTVLLFTKPGVPGRVKTRLIGELTAAAAAELHGALLADILDNLSTGRFRLELRWSLEEGEEPPDLGLPASRQEGRDLGERLFRALEEAAAAGALVAAVGSDHPELSASGVEAAFEALEAGADLVLGPAADGGYYLIAARPDAVQRSLFAGVPWSTPAVLEETLARAARSGLLCHLLPRGWDVDTAADLAALAVRLAAGAAHCPATERLLAGWGRLERR